MKAYFIANFSLSDYDKFPEYRQKTMKTLTPYIKKGEVKVLVAASGEDLGTKEGKPLEHIVIMEFKSKGIAEEWYNSNEYQKLIQFRQAFTEDIWLTITNQFIPPNT